MTLSYTPPNTYDRKIIKILNHTNKGFIRRSNIIQNEYMPINYIPPAFQYVLERVSFQFLRLTKYCDASISSYLSKDCGA